MINNTEKLKFSWLATAMITLLVAVIGVLNQSVYSNVISDDILPATISQDLISILAALVVISLSLDIKNDDSKLHLVIMGIFGYFCYAYGIYVIEQLYNLLYIGYMAILSLSAINLIYGLANLDLDLVSDLEISSTIKKAASGYMLINAVMFNILWLSQLLPLLQTGNRIEHLFSIFIIDLCFIMPAFFIITIKLLKDDGLGLVLTPIMFVLGFAILFPLFVGELLRPILVNQSMKIEEMSLFLVLSLIFLILDVIYLRNLKIPNHE